MEPVVAPGMPRVGKSGLPGEWAQVIEQEAPKGQDQAGSRGENQATVRVHHWTSSKGLGRRISPSGGRASCVGSF